MCLKWLSPIELWTQLTCIDEKLFGSYTAFAKKYCNAHRSRFGWEVSGISNKEELHQKLRTVMIRRLKSEVLHDLPKKQRSIVYMIVSEAAENTKEAKRILEELNASKLDCKDLLLNIDEMKASHFETRRLMMAAYQASGIAKAPAVADYASDWLSGTANNKLVIFAHHTEVLDTIEMKLNRTLKGVGLIRIDGTTSSKDRARYVAEFQSKEHIRVALLSVTAAGVGLTLTAASAILFAELHWTPGTLVQAEDRCHRIGQKQCVNVTYCINKDTSSSIDMVLWDIIGRKMKNVGMIIDGTLGSMDVSSNTSPTRKKISSSPPGSSSGEVELIKFFSEEAAVSNRKKGGAGKPLVRGSIQSFFRKQTSKNLTPLLKTPSSVSKFNGEHSLSSRIHSDKSKVSRVSVGSDDEVSKRIKSWNCKLCTFENTTMSLKCDMCGYKNNEQSFSTPLDASVHSRKTASSTHGDSNDKVESIISLKLWKCEQCTFINENSSSSTSCSMCHSKRCKNKTSKEVVPISQSIFECIDLSQVIPTSQSQNIPKEKECIDLTQNNNYDVAVDEKDHNRCQDKICTSSCQPMRISNEKSKEKDYETKSSSLIKFSISKNSSRIAIHLGSSLELIGCNFDISEVIRDGSTKTPYSNRNVRERPCDRDVMGKAINFDEDAIFSIYNKINIETRKNHNFSHESFEKSLVSFINAYLSLRDVERKALQGNSIPVDSNNLYSVVSSCLKSSVKGSYNRYGRGPKQRAFDNLSNDSESLQKADIAMLEKRACSWCGNLLASSSFYNGVVSQYCSQTCAEEGRLRKSSVNIRAQLFALERGRCSKCGLDAYSLFKRIQALQPVERLNTLQNSNFNLPKRSSALQRLLQYPKEGDFWQADHIVPVSEGGGNCSLDNLRTLCTPCHRKETESLHVRLKVKPRQKDNNNERDRQTCIRDIFGSRKSAD